MGLFQGTIVPCAVGLQVYWLPKEGTEKIWASRALPLGSVLGQVTASVLTPRLATSGGGWRRVAYTYGAANLIFAAVWHYLAADRPAKWRGPPAMGAEELAMLEASSPDNQPKAESDKASEKGEEGGSRRLSVGELLRVPAARGCCCSAFAIGTLVCKRRNPLSFLAQRLRLNGCWADTITPRAPGYFMSELGTSPLRTGQLLALPPVVMQVTDTEPKSIEHRLGFTFDLCSSSLICAGYGPCVRCFRGAAAAPWLVAALGAQAHLMLRHAHRRRSPVPLRRR